MYAQSKRNWFLFLSTSNTFFSSLIYFFFLCTIPLYFNVQCNTFRFRIRPVHDIIFLAFTEHATPSTSQVFLCLFPCNYILERFCVKRLHFNFMKANSELDTISIQSIIIIWCIFRCVRVSVVGNDTFIKQLLCICLLRFHWHLNHKYASVFDILMLDSLLIEFEITGFWIGYPRNIMDNETKGILNK